MKEVSIYIYIDYTGSIAKGSGIYNIIWECVIPTEQGDYPATMKETRGFTEITRNQLALKALEAALEHMRQKSHITIYVDSDYIFAALTQKWLDKWKDNEFISNGKPIKYADTWSHVAALSEQHELKVIKTNNTPYSKAQAIEIKLFKEKK